MQHPVYAMKTPLKLHPWIHYILLGFGVFNLMIGITLFFWYPKVPLSVVSPLIPQDVWASIFLLSGLVFMFGLLRGLLPLLRSMMVFGLFIKIMWEIGLLFRLHDGTGILSVELWGMIAYLQLLAVVFFSPKKDQGFSNEHL